MKSLKSLTILIFLLCYIRAMAVAPMQAPNPDLYQVNIVVFSHLTAKNLTSEQWQAVANPPNTNSSAAPQMLTQDQCALNTEAAKISRRTNYQVLLNTCWLQKLPDGGRATPLLLNRQDIGNNDGQIAGTIAIARQRFFNVALNLLLAEPKTTLDNIATADYANNATDGKTVTFQLLQTRRMKSDELNYIAHPLFGVLLKITTPTPEVLQAIAAAS